MSLTFDTLLYEQDGPVVTLWLNRPEARHALNARMREELPRAWDAIKADDSVRVVIFTATGDRALCSGLDLKEQARSGALYPPRPQPSAAATRLTAWHCGVWKPVICAVNGFVAGGGLLFVAYADLVIAAEHAEFSNPGVSFGILAPFPQVALARRMPFDAAMRMFLVGDQERLSAERARALGLVGEVVAKEELLPAARRLAMLLAEQPPEALAAAKRALWDQL